MRRYRHWQRWLQLLFFLISAASAGLLGQEGLPSEDGPNYQLALLSLIPIAFAGFVNVAAPNRFCCAIAHIEDARRWNRYFLGQTCCFLINTAAIGALGYLQFKEWAWLLGIPGCLSTLTFVGLTFKDRWGNPEQAPSILITFHEAPSPSTVLTALQAPLLLSYTSADAPTPQAFTQIDAPSLKK